MTLPEFVRIYGLEDEVEPLLLTAKFERNGRMEMQYHAPGKARNVGKIVYYTLARSNTFGVAHWGACSGSMGGVRDGEKLKGLFPSYYVETDDQDTSPGASVILVD
jgi:hypothetical protein